MPLADMLATRQAGAVEERGDAAAQERRRLRQQRRASPTSKARLTAADAIGGEVFVLRKGRKDHHIVKLRAKA